MSKKVKLSLIISLITLVVIFGAFMIYVACGYKADDTADALLEAENVDVMDGYIIVSPTTISNGVGLVFYPGGNVEYTAYLPLLDALAARGITCYLVEMPFNFAIFDGNAADKIFDIHGDDHQMWYMCGHSLGGSMASQYASEHSDMVDGLILLGSYPYKEYPLEDTLTIYGSLNTSVDEKVDYEENVYVIEGGNHAYFGNYGEQAGDPVGDISREDQQYETVRIIMLWLLARHGF